MSIKLGQSNISNIYLGNTGISKIYKGTDLIYQKEEPSGPPIINTVNTYSPSSLVTDDGWLDFSNSSSCSFKSPEFGAYLPEQSAVHIEIQFQFKLGAARGGDYPIRAICYATDYYPRITIYGPDTTASSRNVLMFNIVGTDGSLYITNEELATKLCADIEYNNQNVANLDFNLLYVHDAIKGNSSITLTRLDTGQSITKTLTVNDFDIFSNITYFNISRSAATTRTMSQIKIDTIQVAFGSYNNNTTYCIWQPSFPIIFG